MVAKYKHSSMLLSDGCWDKLGNNIISMCHGTLSKCGSQKQAWSCLPPEGVTFQITLWEGFTFETTPRKVQSSPKMKPSPGVLDNRPKRNHHPKNGKVSIGDVSNWGEFHLFNFSRVLTCINTPWVGFNFKNDLRRRLSKVNSFPEKFAHAKPYKII